jgi:hypothetical protein
MIDTQTISYESVVNVGVHAIPHIRLVKIPTYR